MSGSMSIIVWWLASIVIFRAKSLASPSQTTKDDHYYDRNYDFKDFNSRDGGIGPLLVSSPTTMRAHKFKIFDADVDMNSDKNFYDNFDDAIQQFYSPSRRVIASQPLKSCGSSATDAVCTCIQDQMICNNSNTLTSVPAVAPEVANRILTLIVKNQSRLEILGRNDLANFTRLVQLNISSSGLAEIEDGAFDRQVDIRDIDLSNNSLTQLNRSNFARLRLKSLNIEGNPLTCTCANKWLGIEPLIKSKSIAAWNSSATKCVLDGSFMSIAQASIAHCSVPVIAIDKPLLHVNQSDLVSLTCIGYGEPDVNVSWILNNKEHSENFATSHRATSNDTRRTQLQFRARMTDNGRFECLASNEVGETRAIANVFVHGAPNITSLNRTKDFYWAVNYEVTGHPQPKLEWFHNDTILPIFKALKPGETERGYFFAGDPATKRGLLAGHLYFMIPQDARRGNYTLIATNRYGTAKRSVFQDFFNVWVPPSVSPRKVKTMQAGDSRHLSLFPEDLHAFLAHITPSESVKSSTNDTRRKTVTNSSHFASEQNTFGITRWLVGSLSAVVIVLLIVIVALLLVFRPSWTLSSRSTRRQRRTSADHDGVEGIELNPSPPTTTVTRGFSGESHQLLLSASSSANRLGLPTSLPCTVPTTSGGSSTPATPASAFSAANFGLFSADRSCILAHNPRTIENPCYETTASLLAHIRAAEESSTSIRPDAEPTRISSTQITLKQQLGEGAFGRVFFATYTAAAVGDNEQSSLNVAVKILKTGLPSAHTYANKPLSSSNTADIEDLTAASDSSADRVVDNDALYEQVEREARVLSALRHPHIVHFYGISVFTYEQRLPTASSSSDSDETKTEASDSVAPTNDQLLQPESKSLRSRTPPRLVRQMMMVFEYMQNGDLNAFLRVHGPDAAFLRCADSAKTSPDSAHAALLTAVDEDGNVVPRSQPNYDIRSASTLVRIARDVASAVDFLASRHYVHRDLATRNCLINSELVVKLGDFGMSRDVYHCDYYRVGEDALLPVRWMPPESLLYRKFSPESDVWSFGVLLWEIFTYGKQPWYFLSNSEVVEKIKSGRKLGRPDAASDVCSDELYRLMQRCWHLVPKKRITMHELFTELERMLSILDKQPVYVKVLNIHDHHGSGGEERTRSVMSSDDDDKDKLTS